MPLYVGPQIQDKLAALAPGLNLTVDYGWLTVIASPLFWMLSAVYDVVKNWGVAIIIVTIIIKLIFFPLVRGLVQVDGEDADDGAEAAEAEGTARRRSSEAAPGHDGVVQDREDQSAGRLPADRDPDPGLHRPVLGTAR